MKDTKGITLIALIITIIVMLILVGVSIQVVITNNLLGAAQNAAKKYPEAEVKDDFYGLLGDAWIKKYENGTTLEAYLKEKLGDSNVSKTAEGKYSVSYRGYIVEIIEQGSGYSVGNITKPE